MRLGKYLLLILFLVVAFAASTYAAPVGLTSEADATTSAQLLGENDLGIDLSIGCVADLSKRDLDIEQGEFEMDAYLARIGLSIMERFNFYIDIGQAMNMEYDYRMYGQDHKVSYDDEVIWGTGLSALVYRWDNGLEIGVNASYRQADLKVDKVKIDTLSYQRSQLLNLSEDDFKEYQGGIELAWKKDYFIPYVGVKYSDVELGSSYRVAPTTYNAKGKNADKNYGVFVGLSIIPKLSFLSPSTPDSMPLSINLEGRFIDEEAISAGISYKF